MTDIWKLNVPAPLCVPTIFQRNNVVENVGRFLDDFLALFFEAIILKGNNLQACRD